MTYFWLRKEFHILAFQLYQQHAAVRAKYPAGFKGMLLFTHLELKRKKNLEPETAFDGNFDLWLEQKALLLSMQTELQPSREASAAEFALPPPPE